MCLDLYFGHILHEINHCPFEGTSWSELSQKPVLALLNICQSLAEKAKLCFLSTLTTTCCLNLYSPL